MRTFVVLTIWAFVGIGCVPVLLSQRSATSDLLVKVPAKPGIVVTVPAAGRNMSVWYRSEPVGCVAKDDGSVQFTVKRSNRHSPYLMYELGPADMRPCQKDSESQGKETYRAEIERRPFPHVPRLSRDTDIMIVAPELWLDALGPLIDHRQMLGHRVATISAEDIFAVHSAGNPDPVALRKAVRQLHAWTRGELKFLLLVGDVQAQYEPSASSGAVIPTFYGQKLPYPGYTSDFEFATDHPYSLVGGKSRIAVGRIPARSEAELAAVVDKIVRYETQPTSGDWSRKLVVVGGPANISPVVDELIESEATQLLTNAVPYDFDIDVTFASPRSPYAYPFDQFSDRLVRSLNSGALIATYLGHGLPDAFDEVYYRGSLYKMGTGKDLAALNIQNGHPFFLSLTCHTGYFDRIEGEPSLSERMILNAQGPIAAFASSRESHPYVNALYARALIARFLKKRARTIGEGLLDVKLSMMSGRHLLAEAFLTNSAASLKREHLGLYNLLGDPATRLRYPGAADVTLETASGATARPQQEIGVNIRPSHIESGQARITLETRRDQIRGKLATLAQLNRMSVKRAFKTMEKNHAKAANKVVHSQWVEVTAHGASTVVTAPSEPGSYYVKVFVKGHQQGEVGHAAFTVVAPLVKSLNQLQP